MDKIKMNQFYDNENGLILSIVSLDIELIYFNELINNYNY